MSTQAQKKRQLQVSKLVRKKGLDPVFRFMTLLELYENGMITNEEYDYGKRLLLKGD